MAHSQSNKNNEPKEKKFIEILGDTVSSNQLIISIILSVTASLLGYEFGQWLFPKFAEANMVNSYSLLTGIAAILIIVAINTTLFRPKRILLDDQSSATSMREAYEDLKLDIDEEIRLIQEDAVTRKELEELGVLANIESMKGADKK
ncbi:MAG: hypothetical protein KBT36_12275 [Kurthia sp.]|uniref:hypothetical protein n=1 Tax=unclassified Lysinibacillus TaxID=2636778 RepID=UPI000D526E86|nr:MULTISPECIES: hypothetical protein [unclassified Lysinibacillus]AWE06925.1 hypothetical protein DCE79_05710 [Lysinibacillus sp. 2017]MBQ0140065.1 hypothetical protein [Candidatus Kurthia equi]TGN37148.1 hypothetical protein E4L99_01290 [Lysinibacillus sp. S2017]